MTSESAEPENFESSPQMIAETAAATSSFNPQRVVRRLAAAEGFLELGLPAYALTELGRVNDAGPFEPIRELFRGEALQAQEKFADAIGPLNRAAELFPKPFNQRALMALSDCYRHEGKDRLADEAVAAALPPNVDPIVAAKSLIAPIFLIKPVNLSQSRSTQVDNE